MKEVLFPLFPCTFKFLCMPSINEGDQLYEIKHSLDENWHFWLKTYLTIITLSYRLSKLEAPVWHSNIWNGINLFFCKLFLSGEVSENSC